MFEEFKNAFARPNYAHVQLIWINVAVFVILLIADLLTWMLGAGAFFETIYRQFSMPSGLSEYLSRPWTLLTYMFTHSMRDIFHILFNMLVLYWFGRLFVEYLGGDKLVALYILGGLTGGIAYLLLYNLNPGFFGRAEMVGASGAIYAVVVATAVLLPNYTFYLLFFGPVRIKYIAMFYVIISVLYVRHGVNLGGNIAHLGGALMGFVYMKQLQAGVNWGGWITETLYWIKGLFRPRSKVKVSYRNVRKTRPSAEAPDKVPQEEIDAILDKISAGGYDSLTREEKEKLFRASRK
ncbi:MAG: rhomboid family intramembrane serine protease [Cyclobacteriaceae bacterium]|nr:MAG: rhomboid family intramembrane serine protease [Cyclobacteriaceae bacterium]